MITCAILMSIVPLLHKRRLLSQVTILPRLYSRQSATWQQIWKLGNQAFVLPLVYVSNHKLCITHNTHVQHLQMLDSFLFQPDYVISHWYWEARNAFLVAFPPPHPLSNMHKYTVCQVTQSHAENSFSRKFIISIQVKRRSYLPPVPLHFQIVA